MAADALHDHGPYLGGTRGAKVVMGGALALPPMELGLSYEPRLGPPASLPQPPATVLGPAGQTSALALGPHWVFDHPSLQAKALWNMVV